MADILDKVIDIAKKLRKTAKKVTDPAVQTLITDLNLSLADLKVQVMEQRQAAQGTPAATSRAEPMPATPSPSAPAPTTRTLGTTILSNTPDIGDLRKFPN